jgi:hypothetical protein
MKEFQGRLSRIIRVSALFLALALTAGCAGKTSPDYPVEDAGPSLDCFEGDFEIRDATDVETLAPYSCVEGNLLVNAQDITDVGLPNLVWVQGGLVLLDCGHLAELSGLGSLKSVGSLLVDHNVYLTELEGLDSLAVVVGEFVFYQNYSLPQCEAYDLLDGLDLAPDEVVICENQPDSCPATGGEADDCMGSESEKQ